MDDELEKDLDESVEDQLEQQEQEDKGNKFSKTGKIFLVIAMIVAQGIAAFAVVKNNYADIREIVGSMETKGGYYFELENIIINPAQSNGNRYLVLSLAIELNTSGDMAQMEKMKVEVLDKINYQLIQKTTEELSNRTLRETIKNELKVELNSIFQQEMVRNLYFTKYVIQ